MQPGEYVKKDLAHVWHHVMAMHEVVENGPKIIARGEGVYVWDIDGKRYLDAMSGIYTTPIGHGRKEIRDAIYAQAEKLEFYPNFQYFTTPPVIELAEKLAELCPGDIDRFFFVSGGSEAVDTAFKIARQYHRQTGHPHKYKVIALRGGFHGTTFGAGSATGITLYREPYEPLVPGFRHVPAPFCYRCPWNDSHPQCGLKCVDALEQQIVFENPDTVAAVIAEPVINPIGEVPPPADYFPAVREICDRFDLLFIADEVITGFGRCGTMFALEQWDVEPDIITMAKGMSSGYLPCGATGVRSEIYDAFYGPDRTGFMHGHTFGGHPLTCVAALRNIEIIEQEDLVRRGRETSEYLFARLERLYDHPIVGDVRGRGMLVGIDIVRDQETGEKYPLSEKVGIRIRERAYELGLICRDQRDVIVIAPPLIITPDEVDFIVDVLDRSIGEVCQQVRGGE